MSNERFHVKTFTNPSGRKVFRVSGRLPDGRQIRRNFPTVREAGAFKAQLELSIYEQSSDCQLRRTRLDEAQLAEAEAAFLRLGMSGPSLSMVVDYYLRNYQPVDQTKTIATAYQEFLADKQAQRLRPRSLQDLRSRVDRLSWNRFSNHGMLR